MVLSKRDSLQPIPHTVAVLNHQLQQRLSAFICRPQGLERWGLNPWPYDYDSHALPAELHSKINMIRASPYSSTMQSYSANVTTSLSFRERPWASCRGQSTCRISLANFTVLSDVLKTQYSIEETFCLLPYRYFNEFLVLYPDFSGSRQIDFFESSI